VRAIPAAGLCLALAGGALADDARQDTRMDRVLGKALFERAWVPAPSSARANDGLGPLFDARACAACHPGAGHGETALGTDGRPKGLGLVLTLFDTQGAGDPVYGHRLEAMTLRGVPVEGAIGVRVDADGRRVPRVDAPGYGPLAATTVISLRAAPDLRGRGALEGVSDETILALEDLEDRDGDGVRGRARRLVVAEGGSFIGRFGWKASHADLASQSSEAFALDLGMSTPPRPEPWGDCTDAQTACRNAPHGREDEGEAEISAAILDRIVIYLRGLKVPAPEPDERGAALFASAGCAACHRPSLPTARGEVALYTDVLLHEMGEGLADPIGVPGVGAGEWRTAPLAGISRALARGTGLLHDGRANDVAQAVRWHGGEAAGARARFDALNVSDRAALIAFVSSL